MIVNKQGNTVFLPELKTSLAISVSKVTFTAGSLKCHKSKCGNYVNTTPKCVKTTLRLMVTNDNLVVLNKIYCVKLKKQRRLIRT